MRNIFAILFFGIIILSCNSTQPASIKGTNTTINTISGYSFNAIIILENMFESLKIAKDDDNDYILYAYIRTPGNRPGYFLAYIDGTRYEIGTNLNWDIRTVNGNAFNWDLIAILNNDIIEKIKECNKLEFRAVSSNSSTLLGKENGVDVSFILPQIKDFLK